MNETNKPVPASPAQKMKVLEYHNCLSIQGYWRWRCINCDILFRKHPHAATCKGPSK